MKSVLKGVACVLVMYSCFSSGAVAQHQHAQHASPPQPAQHSHPPQDADLHEKFYSTWYMPDQPHKSCCNKADCYPTEIKMIGGNVFAKRREDGKFILVPASKVERNRDNPDGRNHICAPPPTAVSYPPDTVFCFSLGSGI